jgi:hypothetical protein
LILKLPSLNALKFFQPNSLQHKNIGTYGYSSSSGGIIDNLSETQSEKNSSYLANELLKENQKEKKIILNKLKNPSSLSSNNNSLFVKEKKVSNLYNITAVESFYVQIDRHILTCDNFQSVKTDNKDEKSKLIL